MLTEEQVRRAKEEGRRGPLIDWKALADRLHRREASDGEGAHLAVFVGGCLEGREMRVPSRAPERYAYPDRELRAGEPRTWNGRTPIAGAHLYRLAAEPGFHGELRYIFRRVASR